MNVGILTIDIHLRESGCLKDKRRVLRRLKDRMRNNFNVSVAEIGDADKWQKAVLAVAVVSKGKKHVSECLDKIMNFVREDKRITVVDYSAEVL
ncbi:MAG: DUF503 domain-containing protein [Candidatus Omnitrophota bacterium]|nr:DUF503 domain-containing protein [Candidatus Omnitrophota bacterium]